MIMASRGSAYLFFLFLLSLLCCHCTLVEKLEITSRKALFDSFHFQFKATRHDIVTTPPIPYPATPVTNPVTTPTPVTNPVTTPSLVPPVVTVPATNPIGVTPNPVPVPPAVPVPVPSTNPVTPAVPVPSTNPVTPAVPVTNPVTTPPVTNPVTAPPATTTNPPAASGQSWCVAKSGTVDTALQSAIDYACGMGGADCSTIQQGGTCYNPNTLQNHASVAFNSYFQKNPSPTSCDFGGTAMITNVNPSSGSCVYATLSSSSSTTTPGIPAPTTASSSGGTTPTSSGTPPTVMNASNPASGTTAGFGDGPLGSSSSISASNHFQQAIGGIVLMITTTITWMIIFI